MGVSQQPTRAVYMISESGFVSLHHYVSGLWPRYCEQKVGRRGQVMSVAPARGLGRAWLLASAATDTRDESVNTPASRTTKHIQRHRAAPDARFWGSNILFVASYARPCSARRPSACAAAFAVQNKHHQQYRTTPRDQLKLCPGSQQYTAIALPLELLRFVLGHAAIVSPLLSRRCHHFVLV